MTGVESTTDMPEREGRRPMSHRRIASTLALSVLVVALPVAAQVDIEGPGGGPQPDPIGDIQVGLYLYMPGPDCSADDYAFAAKNTSPYFEYKVERTGNPEITCDQSHGSCNFDSIDSHWTCPAGCSSPSNSFDGFMGPEVLGVSGSRSSCASSTPAPAFTDCNLYAPGNQCDTVPPYSGSCDDERWCASIPDARVVATEYRSVPNGSWTVFPGGPVTICDGQAVLGQSATTGHCVARSMCFEVDCSSHHPCEPPPNFPVFTICDDLPLAPGSR